MNNTHHQSCTTVLVGKKASVDGSVMIARNEDFHEAVSVKLFTVMPASEVQTVLIRRRTPALPLRCRRKRSAVLLRLRHFSC